MELKTNLSFFSLLKDTATFIRNRLQQFLLFSGVFVLLFNVLCFIALIYMNKHFYFIRVGTSPEDTIKIMLKFLIVIIFLITIYSATLCAIISNFCLSKKFDFNFFIEKFFSNVKKILLTNLAMIIVLISFSIILSFSCFILNFMNSEVLTDYFTWFITTIFFMLFSGFIFFFFATLIDPNQQKSWSEQMRISFKLVFKNKLITIIALILYIITIVLTLFIFDFATQSISSSIFKIVLGLIFSTFPCMLQIFFVSFFYRIYFLSVNNNEQVTPQENDNHYDNNRLIV